MLNKASVLMKGAVSNAESLRNGSFVFVNVLKKVSEGTYSVSVDGIRQTVKSEIDLRPGDRFPAEISFDGEKIKLSVLSDGKNENAVLLSENLESSFYKTENYTQNFSALFGSSFAGNEGEIVLCIIKFLQQSGVKLNPEKIIKAKRAASGFKNKKKAAEAAVFLLEKGLPADEDNIRLILDADAESSDEERKNPGDDSHENGKENNKKSENESKKELNEPSKTELLKQINRKEESDYWILIPYDYEISEKKASGLIRMKKNPVTNQVSKLFISVNYEKKYLLLKISLNYNKIRHTIDMCRVLLCFSKSFSNSEREKVQMNFKRCTENPDFKVEVSFADFETENSLFTDSDALCGIRTEA